MIHNWICSKCGQGGGLEVPPGTMFSDLVERIRLEHAQSSPNCKANKLTLISEREDFDYVERGRPQED
jgi:rubredoxin